MRFPKIGELNRKLLAAITMSLLSTPTYAVVILDNSPPSGNISTFGIPDPATKTYGEVFTAPVSGTLSSFTLWLSGGVGSLYGGVGTWNGGTSFVIGFGSPVNLYQSADVPSLAGGPYSFTPGVSVTAGQQYVAYVSVFGDASTSGSTSMPLSSNSVVGLDYFVFNNTTDERDNAAWNYFANFGNAQFDAVFLDAAAVPEPATLALFGAGLAGLGALRRRRKAKALTE